MSEQAKKTTRKTGTRPRKTAPKAAKEPKQATQEETAPVSVAALEQEGNAAPTPEADDNASAAADNGNAIPDNGNAAGDNENGNPDNGAEQNAGNPDQNTGDPERDGAEAEQTAPAGGEEPKTDPEQSAAAFEVCRVLKITKPLMKGDDVKALQ